MTKPLLSPLQRLVYVALLDLNGEASSQQISDHTVRNAYFMEGMLVDTEPSVGSVANTLCWLRGKGFVKGPRDGLWYVPYTYIQKYGHTPTQCTLTQCWSALSDAGAIFP